MKPVLPLFIMVDACGWEIVKDQPFLATLAPHRKKLKSVFGYSSACIPSIVSGRWPDEHRNWCYFVYAPEASPLRRLKALGCLPKALTSRRIFRRWLTRFVKVRLNFRGYFDLYNIPFQHISLFDFSEKKSPLRPGGMNRGTNIFDFLEERQIPYFVSDPSNTEAANLAEAIRQIRKEQIDFAFIYWPGLDGLLHQVGNDSPRIPLKLREYEDWIEKLLLSARKNYQEVHLYVFSDHGMANCDELLDLKAMIEPLPVEFGRDYAVVYDSTMARFWFFNNAARQCIISLLHTVAQGQIVTEEELRRLRTFFEDRSFGELIFLVNEGVLIVPSHMGERPIRAMHGYHPSEKHSFAALFTNLEGIPDNVSSIPDIYRLMTQEAELAQIANLEAAHQLGEVRTSHPTRTVYEGT